MSLYIWSTHKKMLCLEIPGCVQHKVMYGVALWRDRSHYMDHRIVLITMWNCWLPGATRSQALGRRIGHSVSVTTAGTVKYINQRGAVCIDYTYTYIKSKR